MPDYYHAFGVQKKRYSYLFTPTRTRWLYNGWKLNREFLSILGRPPGPRIAWNEWMTWVGAKSIAEWLDLLLLKFEATAADAIWFELVTKENDVGPDEPFYGGSIVTWRVFPSKTWARFKTVWMPEDYLNLNRGEGLADTTEPMVVANGWYPLFTYRDPMEVVREAESFRATMPETAWTMWMFLWTNIYLTQYQKHPKSLGTMKKWKRGTLSRTDERQNYAGEHAVVLQEDVNFYDNMCTHSTHPRGPAYDIEVPGEFCSRCFECGKTIWAGDAPSNN